MNSLLKLQLKPRITLFQLLLAAYGVGMCLTLWAMRSHYPILFLILFCLIPLSSGAIVGNRLAASNISKNCRRQINRMFLAIATMAAFILLCGQFNIYRLFPLIGLTLDDLIATGKPAILTVKEPVDGVIFNHAVALLSIDGKARTVTIGNPLYGRQVLTFEQMKGYWIGQAIFVTYPPKV